jgi:hypothetical protein
MKVLAAAEGDGKTIRRNDSGIAENISLLHYLAG